MLTSVVTSSAVAGAASCTAPSVQARRRGSSGVCTRFGPKSAIWRRGRASLAEGNRSRNSGLGNGRRNYRMERRQTRWRQVRPDSAHGRIEPEPARPARTHRQEQPAPALGAAHRSGSAARRATSSPWFFGLAPTIHPLSQVDAANGSSEPAGRLGYVKLSEKLPHPKAFERVSTTASRSTRNRVVIVEGRPVSAMP